MGDDYQERAADSSYNAHYDRPAVIAALGSVRGRRVLDAACGPGFYAQELVVVSTQHPTTDWLRKGGSYFEVRLETDLWRTPSGEQAVRFWREPLSALCASATGAGFLIGQVIEPLPAETMRERYPDDYEKLSREPGFLILRLVKPGSAKED
jgi:hypothetical protein